MNTLPLFLRIGAVAAVVVFFLLAGSEAVHAQATNEPAVVKPDEMTQSDLLKAYLHLQEQLHFAQISIERNHLEYQEAARAQVAAITEKLAGIQAALEAERQRQQEETQRSNRTLLWVASAFGAMGLLAMLVTAFFQWRTMGRMADISALRAQLPAPMPQGLLPHDTSGLPGGTLQLSNQRLMSVIDRLEHRVLELEHTASKPLPAASTPVDGEFVELSSEQDPGVARITLLLGKGQSLLNADKAMEALDCYDEILRLDADHPEALVKKGAALERLKKDDEALRCYDRAIAANGSLTIAYLYKGGVYNRLERYSEALECYEQALRVQGGAG